MLRLLELPAGAALSSSGEGLFYECYSMLHVVLPTTMTAIGAQMFYRCRQLQDFEIPATVTSIGSYAFYECIRLTKLEFPAGVTSIAANAFNGTAGGTGLDEGRLKVFDFRRAMSVPTLANVSAFASTRSDKEIIVPDELYEDWIAANNWNSTTNNIVDSIVKASESSLGPLT